MFEPYANFGPRRRKRKPLRPFKDYHGWLGEQVLHAQRFEIVKTFDTIQVTVKNRLRLAVGVKERERGAGYIFFTSRAERADDAFG